MQDVSTRSMTINSTRILKFIVTNDDYLQWFSFQSTSKNEDLYDPPHIYIRDKDPLMDVCGANELRAW